MNAKLAQYQLDLDAICGPSVRTPRRLTGIEKEALEARPILDAIDEEYQREFGGQP